MKCNKPKLSREEFLIKAVKSLKTPPWRYIDLYRSGLLFAWAIYFEVGDPNADVLETIRKLRAENKIWYHASEKTYKNKAIKTNRLEIRLPEDVGKDAIDEILKND